MFTSFNFALFDVEKGEGKLFSRKCLMQAKMDKLKKVLSGDDEDEERGIVAEVWFFLSSDFVA